MAAVVAGVSQEQKKSWVVRAQLRYDHELGWDLQPAGRRGAVRHSGAGNGLSLRLTDGA
jgi:hypothetical protein